MILQVEDIVSRARQLKDLIEQSESTISVNLDNQRNIMMQFSLKLEMATFSATLSGLVGVAFGMNLDTAFEHVR